MSSAAAGPGPAWFPPLGTHPAVDCHAHVYDPAYPFAANPRYIPEPAVRGTAAQFAAVLDAHGFTHGLLVAAAPYGGHNGHILDAIEASEGRFKGIAVLETAEMSDNSLDELAGRGIVGLRVNLSLGLGELEAPCLARVTRRMRELGWFLQVHSVGNELAAAVALLDQVGVPLMFDHFARPDPAHGLEQAGFQALLRFGRRGGNIVKISGPFRAGRSRFPHHDVDPFVAAAIESFGLNNCVWGSDWPFVNMDERADFGPPLSCLARWLPDVDDRRRVLWDNPARLFGFSALPRQAGERP